MREQLNKFSREELDVFMIDCHGFSREDVQDWEDKQDLISDIISFGHGQEALEYLA